MPRLTHSNFIRRSRSLGTYLLDLQAASIHLKDVKVAEQGYEVDPMLRLALPLKAEQLQVVDAVKSKAISK